MPHIHTEDGQHDTVVSMYIFRTNFDRPKVLLHMHRKHSKWMQFGGHVELNESPWQAVVHELLEESGYEMSQLKLLQPPGRMKQLTGSVLHPQPVNINTHAIGSSHYHSALEYAFVASGEPLHAVDEAESQDFRLLDRDEVVAIPEGEIYEANRETVLYIFDRLLGEWEQVETRSFKD